MNIRCHLSFALLLAFLSVPFGGRSSIAGDTTAEQEREAAKERVRARRVQESDEETAHRLTQELSDMVAETASLLTRLQKSSAEYQKEVSDLGTSDGGKRLARDQLAFVTFVRFEEEPLFSDEVLLSRKTAMSSIAAALDRELKRKNSLVSPSDAQKREVEDARYWAIQNLSQVTERQDWLRSAVANAPEADTSKQKSLADAVRDFKAKRTADWSNSIVHGRESAKPESEQLLAQKAHDIELERAQHQAEKDAASARAELNRSKIEYEMQIKRMNDEQDRRITELERQLAISKAARERQSAETEVIVKKGTDEANLIRLREKCRSAGVKDALAPLLAEGYWQPGDRDFEPSSLDAKPISLSKLRAAGALTRDMAGIKKLYDIGQTVHGPKDRTVRWGFRQFEYMPPEELEQLKKAQAYLIELGDVLVSEKMLEP